MQRINAINRCRPDYYELRRLVELVNTVPHKIEKKRSILPDVRRKYNTQTLFVNAHRSNVDIYTNGNRSK